MKLNGFDVLEELGQGGMATVYRARQVSLDREVAIKVFEPRFEPTPEDLEQFRNEARVAAHLKHPGLVQIYDAVFSGEVCCFVMELVRGYTVGAWCARKGRLGEKEILDLADCVADAPDYAWRGHQVIHCDIKPENVMVDADGTVKVLDLGLAKTARVLQRKERDVQVYGTPQYISPEQAIGQTDLDCRTDIYALGATLYQLATGQTLFHGHPDREAMEMQVRAKAPNPRTLNPALSISFCALIEKMLAKNRNGRQRDWLSVRDDIAAVRRGFPLASGNPVAGVSTVEPGPSPAPVAHLVRAPIATNAASAATPAEPAAATPAEPASTTRKAGPRPPIIHKRALSDASESGAKRPRRRSKAPLVMLLLLLFGAAVGGVVVTNQTKQRKLAEKASAALAAAREAAAAIPESPDSLEAFENAEQLFEEARRHPRNAEAVDQELDALRARKEATATKLNAAAIDKLFADARSLSWGGNIDRAIAMLRDYSGPGAAESKARRDAEVQTLQKRQKDMEESKRRNEEWQERSRKANAERAAATARQNAAYDQIVAMLETSGLGAANDLAAEKASSEPDLFAAGSRCAWLRTFLTDALSTQAMFDKSFALDTPVTLKLRNGSVMRGRIRKFDRTRGELRIASGSKGVDIESVIRLQELAPAELISRLGKGDTPGARYMRLRTYIRYNIPRTPQFDNEQLRGFYGHDRIRALATAPEQRAPSRP